jgi:hypothetical protein
MCLISVIMVQNSCAEISHLCHSFNFFLSKHHITCFTLLLSRQHYSCHTCTIVTWGVCGLVVKVVDFKPLVPHRCGLKSSQGLWTLSCEETIQLVYGTSVVLLRCSYLIYCSEGHLRSSSTSKAGMSSYDLYCVDVT